MLVKVGNTAVKETSKKGRFREGLPIDNLFFVLYFFVQLIAPTHEGQCFPVYHTIGCCFVVLTKKSVTNW